VAEEYNWDVNVTIRVEGKTKVDFEAFVEQIKTLLANARAAEKIVGSKIKARQQFKDEEWHDGLG